MLAQKLMPVRFGKAGGWPKVAPAWICEAMRAASKYEPALSPECLLPYLAKADVPADCPKTSNAYMQLWGAINKSARHVFVLGKADGKVGQATLSLIAKLASHERCQVTVVCDDFAKADIEACAPGVECIELGGLMDAHDAGRKAVVLGRALMEIGPLTICVSSSEVAWTMFGTMAAALAECSRLYAELPSLVAWNGGDRPTIAERFVANGLSRFVELVAPSSEAAAQWAVRYGVECGFAGSIDVYGVSFEA